MAPDSTAGTVLVVGSINLDLVARCHRHPGPGETLLGTDYQEYPGGKGLNQAVASCRSGAHTSLVAAVGSDDAGRRLIAIAGDEGIDTGAITAIDDLPTGRAVIIVDEGGENAIVVVPGANEACPIPDLIDVSVVLAQLEVPVTVIDHTFQRAHSAKATTILNPAPAAALPPDLLAHCDIVVPNEHEIELLGGVDQLRAAGVGTVIVTKGGDGIEITDDSGTRHIPAFPVTPIDTTGAGDTFCGCLAAGLAAGLTVDQACERAIVAAAISTTVHGAVPSIPSAAEIDRRLSDAT